MTKFRIYLLGVTLMCLTACGGPEHATVDQFFRAAQSDDSPTLAAMSAVSPPGEFDAWEVVEVASRTTEGFSLPELNDQLEAAKKDRDATLEAGREFLDEEAVALEQIVPKFQEDPEYRYTGNLGEVQERWLALVEERKEKERTYQDIRRQVTEESGLATKSVMNRGLTVEELNGDVAVTTLLMNLKPVGQETQLPYNVTLRKYDLSQPGSDRVEAARWVIANIEGANEEARAAAAEIAARGPIGARAASSEASRPSTPAPAATPAASDAEAAGGEETVRTAMAYQPRELRGLARVQILEPQTKIENNEVVSTVRVRNAGKDWITRFTATEFWYDDQGTGTQGGSRTYEERFMPGEVIELQLRTPRNPNFYQNQFQFSHANGEVEATLVSGFPQSSED